MVKNGEVILLESIRRKRDCAWAGKLDVRRWWRVKDME